MNILRYVLVRTYVPLCIAHPHTHIHAGMHTCILRVQAYMLMYIHVHVAGSLLAYLRIHLHPHVDIMSIMCCRVPRCSHSLHRAAFICRGGHSQLPPTGAPGPPPAATCRGQGARAAGEERALAAGRRDPGVASWKVSDVIAFPRAVAKHLVPAIFDMLETYCVHCPF